MITSCGVIIKNELNEFLLGHSTGNVHFDLFKGKMEEGETFIQTAIRECYEESNISIKEENLIELGKSSYTKKKNLYLYLFEVKKSDIDMDSLKCHTFTENGSLEIDSYAWFDSKAMLTKTSKGMTKVLAKLQSDNKI